MYDQIEAAGLKGKKLGGAQVSEKHAVAGEFHHAVQAGHAIREQAVGSIAVFSFHPAVLDLEQLDIVLQIDQGSRTELGVERSGRNLVPVLSLAKAA